MLCHDETLTFNHLTFNICRTHCLSYDQTLYQIWMKSNIYTAELQWFEDLGAVCHLEIDQKLISTIQQPCGPIVHQHMKLRLSFNFSLGSNLWYTSGAELLCGLGDTTNYRGLFFGGNFVDMRPQELRGATYIKFGTEIGSPALLKWVSHFRYVASCGN